MYVLFWGVMFWNNIGTQVLNLVVSILYISSYIETCIKTHVCICRCDIHSVLFQIFATIRMADKKYALLNTVTSLLEEWCVKQICEVEGEVVQ